MKAEILKLLKDSDGYLSGQQLCDRFQVSRTAVWKVMEQLKKEGYEIEAVRNKGYRLIGSCASLSGTEIESSIKSEWAGRRVVYFEETVIDQSPSRGGRGKGRSSRESVCGRLPDFRKRQERKKLGVAVWNQYLHDTSSAAEDPSWEGSSDDAFDGAGGGRWDSEGDRTFHPDQVAERYYIEWKENLWYSDGDERGD